MPPVVATAPSRGERGLPRRPWLGLVRHPPAPIARASYRHQDTFHVLSPGPVACPKDPGMSVVVDQCRTPAVRQSVAGRVRPAPRDVTEDRQVARLVRRLVLAAAPGPKPSRHFRG